MTDLEISKALALAIGYTGHTFITTSLCLVYTGHPHDKVRINEKYWVYNHRIFDYRDWTVAGPIAERYDCFPYKTVNEDADGIWYSKRGIYSDTPQRAIALAVIEGAKKC